jgi:hypothetical protein
MRHRKLCRQTSVGFVWRTQACDDRAIDLPDSIEARCNGDAKALPDVGAGIDAGEQHELLARRSENRDLCTLAAAGQDHARCAVAGTDAPKDLRILIASAPVEVERALQIVRNEPAFLRNSCGVR